MQAQRRKQSSVMGSSGFCDKNVLLQLLFTAQRTTSVLKRASKNRSFIAPAIVRRYIDDILAYRSLNKKNAFVEINMTSLFLQVSGHLKNSGHGVVFNISDEDRGRINITGASLSYR